MHDEPELVHALMDLITRTTITFVRRQKEVLGEPPDEMYHWWYRVPAGVRVVDDVTFNVSPAMYAEFCRPYNERLFADFGGGYIHYCGHMLKSQELAPRHARAAGHRDGRGRGVAQPGLYVGESMAPGRGAPGDHLLGGTRPARRTAGRAGYGAGLRLLGGRPGLGGGPRPPGNGSSLLAQSASSQQRRSSHDLSHCSISPAAWPSSPARRAAWGARWRSLSPKTAPICC